MNPLLIMKSLFIVFRLPTWMHSSYLFFQAIFGLDEFLLRFSECSDLILYFGPELVDSSLLTWV